MCFTCPSHPLAVPNDDAFQPCLYQLIVVPGDAGGWAFRDQHCELPLEAYKKGMSAWLYVPPGTEAAEPVTPAELSELTEQHDGPHANGMFQWSEGEGELSRSLPLREKSDPGTD